MYEINDMNYYELNNSIIWLMFFSFAKIFHENGNAKRFFYISGADDKICGRF